ncbi:siderophore ABC transporter substrate-binding protein [Vibrio vulnificus]|uniref:siderophore ABC transporter substrate-binding protein n=1 Tax=Vibrio vulnificus TaxID=672 RepID=UPI0015933BD1|nr:siderophore ABC transporter substrate-binding protein [Vibrio vulnificus]EID4388959.1 siderophore ABC transporter substrate-binding protein [Vibrio vulnificus]ELV8739480.1 siderophore ABC transporter substrate-binding protein [Vibrio vulnificus]MCG6297801.1 siderophore ABC transporter substrate-binding protein [Vibrio vulnificus]NVC70935.1 siderophore ABC transporter substrate-binding protein [Vibrio vulnificus]
MKLKLSVILVSTLISGGAMAKDLVIEHYMGSTKISDAPKRVVVIGHGALDALDYLGIEPVAVAKAPIMPQYLDKFQDAKYASAGSLFEPDFETIYSQKPDLIIIGPRATSKYKELSEIAPTIVFSAELKQGYWQSTQKQWRNMGEIFNAQQKIEQKISQLNEEFAAIKQYNEKNQVDALTIMTSGGNITTFGSRSRFASVYEDFGFKESSSNVKTNNHGDIISYEYINKANPSTLLVIDGDKLSGKGNQVEEQYLDNDLVKATNAYKNKRITLLDLDAWYLSISGISATEKMVSDIKETVEL